jgi:hypothetical protein
MSNTTGRQRLFAAALGIQIDDRMTADKLSALIDQEKKRRREPPTAGQRRTAAAWGVPILESDTFAGVVDRLWQAALARTFVYSVARRMSGSDWREHAECPLSEKAVSAIAADLCSDPERCAFVLEMDNSLSGTKGDAWFRFGKRQAVSEAYQYAEARLVELGIRRASVNRSRGRQATKVKKQPHGCLLAIGGLICGLIATLAVSGRVLM